jgi:hypothetical protein
MTLIKLAKESHSFNWDLTPFIFLGIFVALH